MQGTLQSRPDGDSSYQVPIKHQFSLNSVTNLYFKQFIEILTLKEEIQQLKEEICLLKGPAQAAQSQDSNESPWMEYRRV